MEHSGKKASRDIVQFVAMNELENQSPEAIAKAVLEEIPTQVTDYMTANAITVEQVACTRSGSSLMRSSLSLHCEGGATAVGVKLYTISCCLFQERAVGALLREDEFRGNRGNPNMMVFLLIILS